MNREQRFRSYIFSAVVILVVFLLFFWFFKKEDSKAESRSSFLDSIECSTTYKEQMLGDFIRIPGGYFILPNDLKKIGYEIDSVYVNSFFMAVDKVSLDAYKSVFCSMNEILSIRSLNNSIDQLRQEQIGCFLFRLNQLSIFHYRIPNDVEWMYAYQYLKTIKYLPSLQFEQKVNVDLIFASLTLEPYEICSWEGRREKGDTISNFALSEDLFSSRKGFITKGDIELIYNRDVQARPCGIRLIRF